VYRRSFSSGTDFLKRIPNRPSPCPLPEGEVEEHRDILFLNLTNRMIRSFFVRLREDVVIRGGPVFCFLFFVFFLSGPVARERLDWIASSKTPRTRLQRFAKQCGQEDRADLVSKLQRSSSIINIRNLLLGEGIVEDADVVDLTWKISITICRI
jgi:hypothetical protein